VTICQTVKQNGQKEEEEKEEDVTHINFESSASFDII